MKHFKKAIKYSSAVAIATYTTMAHAVADPDVVALLATTADTLGAVKANQLLLSTAVIAMIFILAGVVWTRRSTK